MSQRHKRPIKVGGIDGLMLTVIDRATKDALGADKKQHIPDAWAFFSQDTYKISLLAMGLEPDTLPEAMRELSIDEIVSLVDQEI